MAELLDYSELQNVSYREQQSTFYLDGKYVNLPPNCIVETYYDKENYKYYYRFLMLTNIHDENTESETMQVAVYTVNENKSVYIMPYSDGAYVKINRRDFMRRLFQYYISMINDRDRFLIYRPWFVHDFLPAYTTLRLRVKTGENSYVNIPYSSSNNSPIIAIYDSDNKQVYCSAYKYMSGGKEQVYNYISSSISLPINTFAPGKYTIKVLRCGFGLLDLVGGGYTKIFEIPEADRYKNPDGSYNPANNTSKWINQPYNDVYLDFNGEYLDFDVVPTLKELNRNYEKYAWTCPSYTEAENKYRAAYAEHGIDYPEGTYSYDDYLNDFAGNCSVDPSLDINQEMDIPMYGTVFNVTARVHKGTAVEDRGTVSFTHYITYFNTNVAAYTGVGEDYDPREYPTRINIDPYYVYRDLSVNFNADFAGYAVETDPFKDGLQINYANPIVRGSVGSVYNYTGATIAGGYQTNVSVGLRTSCSVSMKNIPYKADDSSTSKVARVPCLSIDAQAEYDRVERTPARWEYYERETKQYSTLQENVNKRLETYFALRDTALQDYNSAAETVKHETTQNGLKFDVPIALLLGQIPHDKLLLEVYKYPHDLDYYSDYCELSLSFNNNRPAGKLWVRGLGGRSSSDMVSSGFEVPDIIQGSIDYTGYELCEDYRNWIGTKIYRPSVIDIDLSEIPMR